MPEPARSSDTERATAVVYVRVSKLDEEEKARKLSPDMQRERALALPELRGLRVEVFEDLDISGKEAANRPQYQALLRRLTRGDVRYVAAYDLSRTMRNLREQQDFFDALQTYGAYFIDSSRGRIVDVSDEDEELRANVEGAVNQRERKKIARRIRDSLASKVARGEIVGNVPAGYLRKKEVLPSGKIARTWTEPDPERAPIIQLLFREYGSGNYTYKSLALELNRRGVPQARPPHFKSNRTAAQLWTADTIKDLLRNPRYAGKVPRRDGETFAAAFPALVDDETWAACERVRLKNRPMMWNRGKHGRRRWASPYLLSPVLRCSRCGSTMSGEKWLPDRTHHKERFYYTCYRRRAARACDQPYLPQDPLEAQLLGILRAVCLPPGFVQAVEAAVDAVLSTTRKAPRPRRRKQIDAELERWLVLYTKGHVTEERYEQERIALTAERAALDDEPRQPDIVRQRDTLQTLVDEWEAMTIDERKRLIVTVFKEVQASEAGITRFLAQPDWQPYMRAVVGLLHGGETERETGLEPANLDFGKVALYQLSYSRVRIAGETASRIPPLTRLVHHCTLDMRGGSPAGDAVREGRLELPRPCEQ